MAERSILDLCADPQAFAPWFRDPASWAAWRAFLCALFGLPMSEDQLATYRACTGRSEPSEAPAQEAWLIVGRRGGKSFILALTAVYLAAFFRDWRPALTRGERGIVMVIATDRRQANVIFGYMRALIRDVPMLASLVERETVDTIDLSNGVSVEVHTASYRTIRGRTVVAALLDELAFWRSEDSANPDHEILAAIRPSMATVPDAMLLCASSPYARRGALWEAHRQYYGRDGPVLVWQAATRTMNPSVPERIVLEALERDPAHASAEYLAEFRSDIEGYVSREAIDACVVLGRLELPPVEGTAYSSFVDPSGGSRDSMTLAIAHVEGATVVVDAVRERRPPFSPDDVVSEFAELLNSYDLASVHGDRYAGLWPRERFDVHGVHYTVADMNKNELYQALLPRLNAATIELLDHPRLSTQLLSLERRTARGGKDSIDHTPGGHDDLGNVVAGVAWCLRSRPEREISIRSWGAPAEDPGQRLSVGHGLQPYTGGDFSNWARGG